MEFDINVVLFFSVNESRLKSLCIRFKISLAFYWFVANILKDLNDYNSRTAFELNVKRMYYFAINL